MMENGKPRKRRQLSPEEKWEVFLEIASQQLTQAALPRPPTRQTTRHGIALHARLVANDQVLKQARDARQPPRDRTRREPRLAVLDPHHPLVPRLRCRPKNPNTSAEVTSAGSLPTTAKNTFRSYAVASHVFTAPRAPTNSRYPSTNGCPNVIAGTPRRHERLPAWHRSQRDRGHRQRPPPARDLGQRRSEPVARFRNPIRDRNLEPAALPAGRCRPVLRATSNDVVVCARGRRFCRSACRASAKQLAPRRWRR